MKLSRDSEWFAPLILGLGAAFAIALIVLLIFAVKPPLRDLAKSEQPVFDFNPLPVDLNIGRMKLHIPRNYIRSTETISEQQIKKILLHALLPDMAPHQQKNWWLFEDKTPTSRLIQIRILQTSSNHNEAQRFRYLYTQQLLQNPQSDAPDGLTHYLFKSSANRPHEDVFTGKDRDNRFLLYLCFRASATSLAPNCSRSFPMDKTISLTYRFKRTHLGNWLEIDDRVQSLIKEFNRLSRRLAPQKTISG